MAYLNINKIYEELIAIRQFISIKNFEPIDVIQAAEYLRLKPSYIYILIHKRKIPFYKPLGKRVYFNKAELNEWIKKSKIKSVDEVEQEYKSQHPERI